MPGGDRTGPAGLGPMSGRAAGYCAGYPFPGYMNPIPGRGFGFGFGRGGRGRRNWFYATGLPGWQRAAYGYPFWNAAYGYAPISFSAEQEISAQIHFEDRWRQVPAERFSACTSEQGCFHRGGCSVKKGKNHRESFR